MSGGAPIDSEFKDLNNGIAEIKNLVQNFQTENDKKLDDIDKKGYVTGDVMQKLEQRIEDIDKKSADLEAIVARQTAHSKQNENEEKRMEAANIIRKSFGKKPYETFDEFKHYMEAADAFLRSGGRMEVLSDDQKKSLNEGFDSDGGYWVMPEMSATMIQKEFETSPFEELANIETIGTNRYVYMVDFDEFDAAYIQELKQHTNTDTAKIGKLSIDVFKQYARVVASTEMLEDATFDITGWLTRKIANKMQRNSNRNYILGDGKGVESGILAAPTPASGAGVFGEVERVTTGTAGSMNYDDFLAMFAQLKEVYHGNASVLMSRQVFFRNVMTLKSTDGNYIVNFFERHQSPNMNILGYPVRFMQDMPTAIAANTQAVAFGDFRQAYTVVRRRGMSVLRDVYTVDEAVVFKASRRNGGGITNSEAYKIMQIAA